MYLKFRWMFLTYFGHNLSRLTFILCSKKFQRDIYQAIFMQFFNVIFLLFYLRFWKIIFTMEIHKKFSTFAKIYWMYGKMSDILMDIS